jgi:hypothetical protein
VAGIGSRFSVFVAVDAGKTAVVRLGAVAVRAGIPHSRAMPVTGVNGEVGMWIERSRLPGEGPMTDGALCVEARCHMVGVLRRDVFLVVARDALDRSPFVAIAHMAAETRNGLVSAARGKLRNVVVEARLPGRGACAMALSAIGSETGEAVIDGNCRIEILPVARVAISRCVRELQPDMTVGTWNIVVLSG